MIPLGAQDISLIFQVLPPWQRPFNEQTDIFIDQRFWSFLYFLSCFMIKHSTVQIILWIELLLTWTVTISADHFVYNVAFNIWVSHSQFISHSLEFCFCLVVVTSSQIPVFTFQIQVLKTKRVELENPVQQNFINHKWTSCDFIVLHCSLLA